jgi:hypothetical protein
MMRLVWSAVPGVQRVIGLLAQADLMLVVDHGGFRAVSGREPTAERLFGRLLRMLRMKGSGPSDLNGRVGDTDGGRPGHI